MNKKHKLVLIPLVIVIVAIGIGLWSHFSKSADILATDGIHKATNAVYYWRTVFNLSDKELKFMKKHNVGRMYLRMFDVIDNYGQTEPNATLRFNQKVPIGMEIVPTVFITVDVLRLAKGESDISYLATKIVDRIDHMCSWNDITNWHEIQLDCDWTEETREKFYLLCKSVRDILPKEKLLSSTIRLHQLKQAAPPVDYGVLMVYNTDNFRDPLATNSILNDSTVEQYLKQRHDFKLPLDIALPIYQWNLVFDKKGKFKRIAAEKECKDDEVLKFESVPFATLQKTQSHLNNYLNLDSEHHTTVLYHLNETNINNYSDDEIQSIYDN